VTDLAADTRDDDSGVLSTPPIYIGFDVLQVGRRDLRARPLAERRAFLEDKLDGHTMVLPCRRLPDDGLKAWAVVEERGYEGMVAKDPRSTYRPGSTRSWAKENRSDRELTSEIRRAITKDKEMSTYAKNVKIVAQNGKVTLKGPVRSEDEKKAIEAKAAEVAGASNVDTQIRVAPKR
jgi:ATP-dependent DNA ligase